MGLHITFLYGKSIFLTLKRCLAHRVHFLIQQGLHFRTIIADDRGDKQNLLLLNAHKEAHST